MALSDYDLKSLKPKDKKYRVSDGKSLYLEVHPAGGKYFVWNYRFPPTRKGQQRWHQIGSYGIGSGKWTLKTARKERDRLEVLRKEGQDPRQLKSEKRESVSGVGTISFQRVADEWMGSVMNKHAKTTFADNRNKLNNQILPQFGKKTINSITRTECLEFKRGIEARGAKSQSDKVFGVMRQIFSYAIDNEWIEEPNPARSSRQSHSGHVSKSHPHLEWDDVPQFLNDLSVNKASGDLVVLSCVKVLMLTFMRVGAIVPSKWDEINWEEKIWTIPAERMKGRDATRQEHLIPMAEPLVEVMRKLEAMTGHKEFIFDSPRGKATEHISVASPNHLIKRMGFQGKLVAHGVRHMATTYGQDILKTPFHVIDLQMGHKPQGKVRQAYDKAMYMDERKIFMDRWGELLVAEGLLT